jgi:hypothetical protein
LIVSLLGSSIVVWFGLSWSLELYQQGNARLHRQGQLRPVTVHHLVVEGTMDERVIEALTDKRETQDALMEAVKAIVERVGARHALPLRRCRLVIKGIVRNLKTRADKKINGRKFSLVNFYMYCIPLGMPRSVDFLRRLICTP